MRRKTSSTKDELRPEYDFDYAKAVRGKYVKKLLAQDSNVVVLERDVARTFRDPKSVNKALRSLISDGRNARSAGKR